MTELTYYTPLEVARLLQVSTKSVYRWSTSDPTMPVLRIGATVRFPKARLESWLRAREQGAGQAHRSSSPSPVAPNAPRDAEIQAGGEAMRHSMRQSSPELRVVRARRTGP